jgi:hypothetical protein
MAKIKQFFSHEASNIVLALVLGYAVYWGVTQKTYSISDTQIKIALICILALALSLFAIYQFVKYYFESRNISRSKQEILKEIKQLAPYLNHVNERALFLRSEIEMRYIIIPHKAEYNLKFVENILIHIDRRVKEINALLAKNKDKYFFQAEDLYNEIFDLNGNSFEKVHSDHLLPKISIRTARKTISDLLLGLEEEIVRNKSYHHKINA